MGDVRFYNNDRRNRLEQEYRYRSAPVTSEHKTRGFRLERLERDGEPLLVFPDWNLKHDRRVQRGPYLAKHDSAFWATVAVACGRPGAVAAGYGEDPATRRMEHSPLEMARHDVDAIYDYYRPPPTGSARVVRGPAGRPQGFFECAAFLDNPSVRELVVALRQVAEWIDENQHDPEYTSFQLNFIFSGHAETDDEGLASIVLEGQRYLASDLAGMLLACIPEDETSPSQCRLDLYLDCCRSAAVARDTVATVSEAHEEDSSYRSELHVGQVYCACLDDEDAHEIPGLSHGVFTFAFLNECSRRRPEGAPATNIGLRDVGWRTDAKQHPLLLDFTQADGVAFKFPSLFNLPDSEKFGSELDPSDFLTDPLAMYLRLARELRERCRSSEQEQWLDPSKRVPFSRDELFTNKRFPFV